MKARTNLDILRYIGMPKELAITRADIHLRVDEIPSVTAEIGIVADIDGSPDLYHEKRRYRIIPDGSCHTCMHRREYEHTGLYCRKLNVFRPTDGYCEMYTEDNQDDE